MATPKQDNVRFDALTVVSPLACGGEDKDQDRARWLPETRVASLCDGVTTSPRSGEAAELVTDLAPMLFGGDVSERLRGVCQLLISRRLEAQRERVVLPPDVPQAMQEMLAEVAREHLGKAFQTTLVAAQFTPTDDGVIAEIIRCGDSAFFAFSAAGDLLTSSPSGDFTAPSTGSDNAAQADSIPFSPGDELLVKVLGRASDPAVRADIGQIDLKVPARWLICAPLDRCHRRPTTAQHGKESPTLWLSSSDLILVPEYLLGRVVDQDGSQYRRIGYSPTIRSTASPAPPVPEINFTGKGSVTDVLPDHYFTDRWIHRQDRFPPDTGFVLASDGFYESFADPQELWAWLSTNKAHLHEEDQRRELMQQLHVRLHDKRGDDDMSFVWVFPKEPVRQEGVRSSKRGSSKEKRNAP